MSRVQPLINNFRSGELSPLMLGRVQSEQYAAGCKVMENCYPDPRGGVRHRGGSVFVAEVKDSTKRVRLVPFIISEIEAYVLELGEDYIRYYNADHEQVESGGSPVETTSPWDEGELRDVQYAQSNDEMWLVHDGYKPRKLTFTSATSWALANATTTGAPWAGNSDGHADGFPRTVAFFEQRLFFGGTLLKPNYVWGSRAADFEEFTIPSPSAPDDPVEYALAAYTRDTIQWMRANRVLFIGTTGNEFRLVPNAYVATDNLPDVNEVSSYGSRHIQPVKIGRQTMFVQASGREVRSYDQDPRANIETYSSLDMTFLAEHITDPGIVELAYQKVPHSLLWAVRSDGVLLSMAYDPALGGTGFEGVGWSRHDLGGEVESVTVIPNGAREEVWVAVKRTIDGNTVRYIEYLDPAVYVDSAFRYTGTATATITGLDHLEGETLDVVADNAVHPQVTVASGQVTLEYTAEDVVLGLRYVPKIVPVPWEGGNPSGTAVGSKRSWSDVKIMLHESGLPLVNGDRYPDRSPASPMDATEPLKTGVYEVSTPGETDDGDLTIEMDLPMPLIVLAITGHFVTNAG